MAIIKVVPIRQENEMTIEVVGQFERVGSYNPHERGVDLADWSIESASYEDEDGNVVSVDPETIKLDDRDIERVENLLLEEM